MSDRYICNKNKHKYSSGYIYLPVEIDGLPKTVVVNGVNLQLKTSFHVSLLCVKNLVEKYGEEIEDKILDVFCKFTEKNDASFVGYEDEFRFAVRDTDNRKTLVVMVNISNFEELFETFRSELNIEVDTQPAHITLYTLELDEGIGINGNKDLSDLTEVVTEQVNDEIRKVLK